MVVLNYNFDDRDFDFCISESKLKTFFIETFMEEGKLIKSNETEKALEFLINRFDYVNDDDMISAYEDEMKDYFEDEAKEEFDDQLKYMEDERDWFGTKRNVVGV